MKIKLLLVFVGITSQTIMAQSNDVKLLQQHYNANLHNSKKHRAIIHSNNPFTFPFRSALFVYQRVISPQWQSDCPHYPSCSGFAFQAISQFGLIKGIALSADRLSRCSGVGLRDYLSYQYDLFTGKIDDSPSVYYWKNNFKRSH